MLVQDKAYLLLLMCLSTLCPAKVAALEQVAIPPEQAMAYLNIRLEIRAIHYGPASRIAQVAGRQLQRPVLTDTKAVMVALMAETATHREVIRYQNPLAALAAVTVAALAAVGIAVLGKVEMQHIMVRVPAVATTIQTAAAAIRA